jgi:hypothetical protein
MSWSRALLLPLVLAALASPASAGLFSRKAKPNPGDRVPELLLQLQTAQDEGVRTAAAEELRQYDAKEFPRIIPALIDAVGRDASPTVRTEAATSLGKLRPISQQAGYALEQAQNNDAAMRVRLAARQSLWQYHLVGYRGGKAEVPAAMDANAANSRPATPSRGPAPHYAGLLRETAEPPLADAPARPTAPPPAPATRAAPPARTVPPLPRAPAPPPPAPATPLADGPALPPP